MSGVGENEDAWVSMRKPDACHWAKSAKHRRYDGKSDYPERTE